MSGLHAAEIDCLLSRTIGDQSVYMGAGARATHSTRLPVLCLGVYARDELPDLKKESWPFALILNTDTRSKPGKHWLVVFGPSKEQIELFDSFGLSPYNYRLAYHRPTHSLIQIQSSFYALRSLLYFFLYFRTNNRLLTSNPLFHDIIQNLMRLPIPDNYIKNFIEILQRTYRSINPCNRTGQCCKLKCSFC